MDLLMSCGLAADFLAMLAIFFFGLFLQQKKTKQQQKEETGFGRRER